MAYIPIEEITLKTDFEAKDVTIINYNASLDQIRTYLEQLRINQTYLYLYGTGGGGGDGGPGVYYDFNVPIESERYVGLTWFDEET